jgi:L-fuculose-phosphate aldolase
VTSDLETRRAIIDACLEMNTVGLNQGTSGNISVRSDDGLLITPSGLRYDRMTPEDIVWVGFDGATQGTRKASSEWRFHRDVLAARPEFGAVVHAHPTYATTLAIHGRSIPAVHYMVAAAGGPDIRCAPYATFGTAELSTLVVEALADRSACLLAHHGMIACGPTLERAMWLAAEVEALARQYHGALQIGEPPVLPGSEIARVLDKFADYGPKD